MNTLKNMEGKRKIIFTFIIFIAAFSIFSFYYLKSAESIDVEWKETIKGTKCTKAQEDSKDWKTVGNDCVPSCGQATGQKGNCKPWWCNDDETSVKSYDCGFSICCVRSSSATEGDCDPKTQKFPDWKKQAVPGGKLRCVPSCGIASDQKGNCRPFCNSDEISVESYDCILGLQICCYSKGAEKKPGEPEKPGESGVTCACSKAGERGGSYKCSDKTEGVCSYYQICAGTSKPPCESQSPECMQKEYQITVGSRCQVSSTGQQMPSSQCDYCTCTAGNVVGKVDRNNMCCVVKGQIVSQLFGTTCAKETCPDPLKGEFISPGEKCPDGCSYCDCVGGMTSLGRARCSINQGKTCCITTDPKYRGGEQTCEESSGSCAGSSGLKNCVINTGDSGEITGPIPCLCGGKECRDNYCVQGKACSSQSGRGMPFCTCKDASKYECTYSSGEKRTGECKSDEKCEGSSINPTDICKKKTTEPTKPTTNDCCCCPSNQNPAGGPLSKEQCSSKGKFITIDYVYTGEIMLECWNKVCPSAGLKWAEAPACEGAETKKPTEPTKPSGNCIGKDDTCFFIDSRKCCDGLYCVYPLFGVGSCRPTEKADCSQLCKSEGYPQGFCSWNACRSPQVPSQDSQPCDNFGIFKASCCCTPPLDCNSACIKEGFKGGVCSTYRCQPPMVVSKNPGPCEAKWFIFKKACCCSP